MSRSVEVAKKHEAFLEAQHLLKQAMSLCFQTHFQYKQALQAHLSERKEESDEEASSDETFLTPVQRKRAAECPPPPVLRKSKRRLVMDSLFCHETL